MNIAVIFGSVRSDRNGERVEGISQKIQSRGHEVSVVDPVQLDLPILDRMYKEMKTFEPKFQNYTT